MCRPLRPNRRTGMLRPTWLLMFGLLLLEQLLRKIASLSRSPERLRNCARALHKAIATVSGGWLCGGRRATSIMRCAAQLKMAAVVMSSLGGYRLLFGGKYLEKRPDHIALYHLMMQGALWLTYEPGIIIVCAVHCQWSSILALAVYAYLSVAKPTPPHCRTSNNVCRVVYRLCT